MTPDELYNHVAETIRRLREAGLDAAPLESIQNTAYTTGSEWLGELQAAAQSVLRQKIKDPLLRRALDSIAWETRWRTPWKSLANIHPSLRHKVVLNCWIGAPLLAFVALGIFASVVRAALRGDESFALLAFRASFGIVFVVAAWFAALAVRWSRRASEILRLPPVAVRLSFVTTADAPFVTIAPVKPAPFARITFLSDAGTIELKTLEPLVLRAHVAPEPRGPVALETPFGYFWSLENGPRDEVKS